MLSRCGRYVPLVGSSSPLRPVCRVLPHEGNVFLTRARASALVCLETAADAHGRRLSQLFAAVRARGALADDLAQVVRDPADTLAVRHLRSLVAPPPPPAQPHAPPPPPPPLLQAPDGVASAGDAVLDSVFGPSWAAKTRRVRNASPYGRAPGWSLVALISKANDDVRQEVRAAARFRPTLPSHASVPHFRPTLPSHASVPRFRPTLPSHASVTAAHLVASRHPHQPSRVAFHRLL
jgi:hypothetical protein